MRSSSLLLCLAGVLRALACESCEKPDSDVVMTRRVRRMQPDAQNATAGPKTPLEWGQVNFLSTTDTHGWLEGHLKEQNYGADWGDFVSFTTNMKQKARAMGVDLLIVDTGDLHDGSGLSDATTLNGQLSNPIFGNIDYDILAIGNHELYVSEIAYSHFYNFSALYGERYLTSNVDILNPATGQYETLGNKYRYFTTEQGLRVMAFGVLYNFTSNSNASRITPAQKMVTEKWFIDAVNYEEPVDMYIVTGHNAPRLTDRTSTQKWVYDAIRKYKKDTPVTFFGGHTHVRDFAINDLTSVGIQAGRYCETVGWLAIDGIEAPGYSDVNIPEDVPKPTRPAIKVSNSTTSAAPYPSSTSGLRYARRYLDWNRRTFAYHAPGSQDRTFDTQQGRAVSQTIYGVRQELNLTRLYGCAPQTWCQFCAPYGSNGSIYGLIEDALAKIVVNEERADVPRILLANTGGIRFDLAKGPFTYDDSFIVIPFKNKFLYIPDVPFQYASQVLDILNAGPFIRKRGIESRDLETRDFNFPVLTPLAEPNECKNPPLPAAHLRSRSTGPRIVRRQDTSELTPGYVTTDDFGKDGDDTPHSPIPNFPRPNVVAGNASLPDGGGSPETVDLVFYDFIQKYVLAALEDAGRTYTPDDVQQYLPDDFTSNSYLPAYAQKYWQANVPNCPVGEGIGS